MALPSFSQIKEDFEALDLWEDRYRYLLDLGKALDPLPESFHTPLRKVSGCVSQLWLDVSLKTSVNGEILVQLRGDSDAHIVRGLAALVFSLYNNTIPEQALAIDTLAILRELNLENHLTPQRSNGLNALVARIRSDIQKQMSASAF